MPSLFEPELVRTIYTRKPKYYKKGCKLENCKRTAIMFKKTWDVVGPKKTITKKKGLKKLNTIAEKEEWIEKHEANLDWETLKTGLYDFDHAKYGKATKNRFKMLQQLKDIIPQDNILTCTDARIEEALRQLCQTCKAPSSIKSKISIARTAFMAIGRRHEYGDGSILTDDMQSVVIHTGCPVTVDIQKTLLGEIRENRDEAMDDKERSHGGPVTFPLMSWYTMNLFSDFVSQALNDPPTNTQNINKLVNKGMLNMALMFQGHVGGPRSEHLYQMKQHDLVFNRADNITYWLTLAFVDTKTLQHIVEHDILQKYILPFPQEYASNKKKPLSRHKYTIPEEYNILDLPYISAIIWRIVLRFKFEYIDYAMNVFHNSGNYADLLRQRNKKYEIHNFVMYGFRYGTIIDGKKANVPICITKRLVGHSENSIVTTKNYEGCDKTIFVAEHKVTSGDTRQWSTGWMSCDPLSETPPTCVPSFIDKFKDESCKQNFIKVRNLVSSFIENRGDPQVALALLHEIFRKRIENEDLKEELASLPLGMNFKFPQNALPDHLMVLHQKDRETLSDIFKIKESTSVPELQNLSMIIYGNWRKLEDVEDVEDVEDIEDIEEAYAEHNTPVVSSDAGSEDSDDEVPLFNLVLKSQALRSPPATIARPPPGRKKRGNIVRVFNDDIMYIGAWIGIMFIDNDNTKVWWNAQITKITKILTDKFIVKVKFVESTLEQVEDDREYELEVQDYNQPFNKDNENLKWRSYDGKPFGTRCKCV